IWHEQMSCLAREGCRVLAVDHLGCGLSDKPQDYDYCLENHVKNFVCFLDELDLHDVTLVMHDWGGPIGLGAAVMQPDRIRSLVFCNTTVSLNGEYPWQIRLCRIPGFGPYLVQRFNLFVRFALWFGTRGHHLNRKAYFYPYPSPESRIALAKFIEDIPFEEDHRTRRYGRMILEQLEKVKTKPVWLLWGMRDICFTPRFLEKAMQLFPHAHVRKFDAGHYVMEDAREEVNQALLELINSFRAEMPATAAEG
ncbi:MAG: alpha/beta fold hydrolase, partial [Lentisphaerae bacterium]